MKKKILIVEDSKLLRAVVQDALKNAGFEIYEAENGLLGLETAKNIHPDVIMPVMDGMTMLRLLREDAWGRRYRSSSSPERTRNVSPHG